MRDVLSLKPRMKLSSAYRGRIGRGEQKEQKYGKKERIEDELQEENKEEKILKRSRGW